jgi:hypothetical protein|nr:MAG TPA: hypothetical protein [Caudoviricetes sp.]
MLIRSQDKRMIVNFDNICTVSAFPEKDSEDIYVEDGTGSLMVGRYSTKEKAMKVLDMIQEAYMEYKCGEIVGNGLSGSAYTGSYDTKESVAHGIAVLKGYGNEIRKSILFQMPEDSEVEV